MRKKLKNQKIRKNDFSSDFRPIFQKEETSLVDALDRVIEKGAVINGDLILQVADVDLVFIGLKLVISSFSGTKKTSPEKTLTTEDKEYLFQLEKELQYLEKSIPKTIDAANPQKTEKNIAQLVLTVIELIRQVLEREAIRRIDKGQLNEVEIRKLGLTFQVIEKKIEQLKKVFGIEKELNINLGPLGKVL